MMRWLAWWRWVRSLGARGQPLVGNTRGASMLEYIIVVGVVALVAASAFADFDAAVKAALTKEPERTARLDGDDGDRNGPTGAEVGEAVFKAKAAEASLPGLRGGSTPRPPVGDRDRSPPRSGTTGGGTTGGGTTGGGTTGGGTTGGGTTGGGTTGSDKAPSDGTTTTLPKGGNADPTTTPTPPRGGDGSPSPSNDPSICTRAGGCAGDNCFVAGTPVATPDGQRAIEQLRIGETVVAYDEPPRAARPAIEQIGGALMTGARSLFDAPASAPAAPAPLAAAEAEWEVELDLSQGTDVHTVSLLLPSEEILALESLTETPVRRLRVGDQVLLENAYRGIVMRLAPSLGKTSARGEGPRIVGLSRHRVSSLVTVATDAETLETTPEHPFYLAGKGWTSAASLAAGDEIDARTPSGRMAIRAVTPHETDGVVVYNLLVEQAHVYRVGASALLVHNGICGSKPVKPKPGPLVIPRPSVEPLSSELANRIPEGTIPTEQTPGLQHLKPDTLRNQNQITDDEFAAVSAWTYNSDNFRTPLNEAFKKKREDLEKFLQKAPKAPGTVYRGLTNVPDAVIEQLLNAQGSNQPVHLGPGGKKDLASASSDPAQAMDFASPNSIDQTNGRRVLLVIDQKNGVAIDELAHKNFKGQKEVLLPASDFYVTKVERSKDGQGDIVIVHVREAP